MLSNPEASFLAFRDSSHRRRSLRRGKVKFSSPLSLLPGRLNKFSSWGKASPHSQQTESRRRKHNALAQSLFLSLSLGICFAAAQGTNSAGFALQIPARFFVHRMTELAFTVVHMYYSTSTWKLVSLGLCGKDRRMDNSNFPTKLKPKKPIRILKAKVILRLGSQLGS